MPNKFLFGQLMFRWQYSLRYFLLAAVLVAIGVGYWLRPRSPVEAFDEFVRHQFIVVRKENVPAIEYETDMARVDALLGKLGQPIPTELRAFVRQRTPKRTFDFGPFRLLSITESKLDYELGVPDKEVWERGFYILIREGDGSAIAYSLDDQRVYHLGFIAEGDLGPKLTSKMIKQAAWESWPSLSAYFDSHAN